MQDKVAVRSRSFGKMCVCVRRSACREEQEAAQPLLAAALGAVVDPAREVRLFGEGRAAFLN